MYLVTLNRAITSNINDLNGNNHYINAFRRSVTKSSDKAVQDLNITNAAMNASLKNRLEQILNEFDKLNQNLLESWRRKFDELKRTTTGTQSNETEASCSRLAPSSEYGFQSLKKKMSLLQVRLSLNVGHLFINQLLPNFTKEVKSKISPVTTEAYW
uniref:SJCHGC04690 protein n=1 Tax=Schistosoma japonicum TaxID=6182 RepID=Q5D8R0_SCHJA|nr:SJCHGC04690 protein [Schistosoma japonicum]